MAKLFVKKGDTVVVVSGKEKGKTAKVLEVSPKANKVLVENVNIVTKHQKQKSQQEKGGIIKKSAPIDASNVMVICPDCGKATRVSHMKIEGKNVRIWKKCKASLDKAEAKKVKKQTKKAEKVEKVEEKVEEPKKATAKKAPAKKASTAKTSTTKTTTAKKTTAKKAETK